MAFAAGTRTGPFEVTATCGVGEIAPRRWSEIALREVLTFTGLLTTVGGPVPKVPPTLQPLTSNGCSVFPDGDTYGCCYVHDMAYWSGGTAADRRRADRELHQCVADVSDSEVIGHVTGGIMYRAVSLFGLPGVPTRVRWGYGWKDTRQISYAALTRAEQDQVSFASGKLATR